MFAYQTLYDTIMCKHKYKNKNPPSSLKMIHDGIFRFPDFRSSRRRKMAAPERRNAASTTSRRTQTSQRQRVTDPANKSPIHTCAPERTTQEARVSEAARLPFNTKPKLQSGCSHQHQLRLALKVFYTLYILGAICTQHSEICTQHQHYPNPKAYTPAFFPTDSLSLLQNPNPNTLVPITPCVQAAIRSSRRSHGNLEHQHRADTLEELPRTNFRGPPLQSDYPAQQGRKERRILEPAPSSRTNAQEPITDLHTTRYLRTLTTSSPYKHISPHTHTPLIQRPYRHIQLHTHTPHTQRPYIQARPHKPPYNKATICTQQQKTLTSSYRRASTRPQQPQITKALITARIPPATPRRSHKTANQHQQDNKNYPITLLNKRPPKLQRHSHKKTYHPPKTSEQKPTPTSHTTLTLQHKCQTHLPQNTSPHNHTTPTQSEHTHKHTYKRSHKQPTTRRQQQTGCTSNRRHTQPSPQRTCPPAVDHQPPVSHLHNTRVLPHTQSHYRRHTSYRHNNLRNRNHTRKHNALGSQTDFHRYRPSGVLGRHTCRPTPLRTTPKHLHQRPPPPTTKRPHTHQLFYNPRQSQHKNTNHTKHRRQKLERHTNLPKLPKSSQLMNPKSDNATADTHTHEPQ